MWIIAWPQENGWQSNGYELLIVHGQFMYLHHGHPRAVLSHIPEIRRVAFLYIGQESYADSKGTQMRVQIRVGAEHDSEEKRQDNTILQNRFPRR